MINQLEEIFWNLIRGGEDHTSKQHQKDVK